MDTQPDNGGDVQFTHNVEPNGAFTLDDDTDTTYDNSVALIATANTRSRVTLQGLPRQHRLESIACDSDDVIIDVEQRRVLIDFKDTDVVCTFVVVGKNYFTVDGSV